MSKAAKSSVLIGNTFPMSLIRRRVTIEPLALEALRRTLRNREIDSFWGHASTAPLAGELLGVDLTPQSERPALSLTREQFPSLNGAPHRTCYVLSPDYVPGFRPNPGAEVPSDRISGWQVLRLDWR